MREMGRWLRGCLLLSGREVGQGGWEVVERLVESSANDGKLQERGMEVVSNDELEE